MISDEELRAWEYTVSDAGAADHFRIARNDLTGLIAEIRRLREQLKPDCLHGCIFKLARKIAEEGK